MKKTLLDLEIERALRSNQDELALELMRQRDSRRLTPRPIVKAHAAPTVTKQSTGSENE